MIRTIVAVIVLIAAVLWLPIWVQIALFAGAVILVPFRLYILIPAIVADALYAPTAHFSLGDHWLTLIVAAMILLHWYVMKKMRIQHLYGLEA